MRLEDGHHSFGFFQGFNPRTRKGCDDRKFFGTAYTPGVSIHAPVKDATYATKYFI